MLVLLSLVHILRRRPNYRRVGSYENDLGSEMGHRQVTVQQEIDATLRAAPHVVLLGAGASKAALPNGDLHGRQVPLLRDVAVDLDLASRFPEDLRDLAASDFEAAYSRLYDRDLELTARIDEQAQIDADSATATSSRVSKRWACEGAARTNDSTPGAKVIWPRPFKRPC